MRKNLSVRKRIRQNKKTSILNTQIRSRAKTAIKKLYVEIKDNNNNMELLSNLVKKVYSSLDKALKKRIFHRNYVAKRKSRVTRKINKILELQAQA